jgi:hypothetical protein
MGRMTVLLLLVAVTNLQAQGTDQRIALAQGAKDIFDARSLVTGVHELPDGRILIAQANSDAVVRLDPRNGTIDTVLTVTMVKGPQGVTLPDGMMLRMSGYFLIAPSDRPAFVELSQSQVVLIDPTGAAPRKLPYATAGATTLPEFGPLAVDGRGHLYLASTGLVVPAGSMSPVSSDSVSIVRVREGRSGVDTVRRVTNPAAHILPRTEQSAAAITMVATTPDGRARDSFTILRDGRLALIAGDDYRVRFVSSNGDETRSAPIPTTPRPLTAEMITAATDSARRVIDAALSQAKAMMSTMLAEMPPEALAMMPQLGARVDAPASMATHLPAHSSVREAPSGLLWVAVPGDLNGRVMHHDVIDTTGTLRARVTIPEGESLLSIGTTVVYTARIHAPMASRLRMYPLPTSLQR